MTSLKSLRGDKDKTNRDFSFRRNGGEPSNPIVLLQNLQFTLVSILAMIFWKDLINTMSDRGR